MEETKKISATVNVPMVNVPLEYIRETKIGTKILGKYVITPEMKKQKIAVLQEKMIDYERRIKNAKKKIAQLEATLEQ